MDPHSLPTPSLLLDRAKLAANIARMNAALTGKEVAFRPHMKTAKSAEIGRLMTEGWSKAVTVSTLKEAEQFLAAGFTDILYAVGITADKLARAAALRAAGADLALILDSVAAAEAVAAYGAPFPVLIEIDSDGHRAGIKPENCEMLVAVARALGANLRGVMTHGGGSYDARSAEALTAHAALERTGTVRAAETLRAAGFACPVVSVGSTPTALFADSFEGVTEVRTGVYAFMDLVMAGLGVCETGDIALSVLTGVIGRQEDRGWLLVDAGWMALSRDRGTAAHDVDQGYGLVCDLDGQPFGDLIVTSANQEHGIVTGRRNGGAIDMARFPIGTRLRILPNHACSTAAQHDRYHVIEGPSVTAQWPRFSGW